MHKGLEFSIRQVLKATIDRRYRNDWEICGTKFLEIDAGSPNRRRVTDPASLYD